MRFFLNKAVPIVYMVKVGITYSAFHNDHEDTWMRIDVPLDTLEYHVRIGLMEETQYEESFHLYDNCEFINKVD